jgi:hypothetical protein
MKESCRVIDDWPCINNKFDQSSFIQGDRPGRFHRDRAFMFMTHLNMRGAGLRGSS